MPCDALLPPGRVLDVGAGDGFTAERLGPAARSWRSNRRRACSRAPTCRFGSGVRPSTSRSPMPRSTARTRRGPTSSPGTGTRRRGSRSSIGSCGPADRSRSSTTSVGTRSPRWPRADISADPAFWAAQGFTCDVDRDRVPVRRPRGGRAPARLLLRRSRRCRRRARGRLPGGAVPSIQPRSLTASAERPASSRGLANSLSDIPRPTAGSRVRCSSTRRAAAPGVRPSGC